MNVHIIDFEHYCPKCESYDLSESESPCWECLENPAAEDSHKPLYFKESQEKTSLK